MRVTFCNQKVTNKSPDGAGVQREALDSLWLVAACHDNRHDNRGAKRTRLRSDTISPDCHHKRRLPLRSSAPSRLTNVKDKVKAQTTSAYYKMLKTRPLKAFDTKPTPKPGL